MSNTKQLVIGLFGFGVVGEGVYNVLQQTPTLNAKIKKICIKDPLKLRNAPALLFTTNKDDLLLDPEINVIVEVINDSVVAYQIVTTAFDQKKAVVSASKKMIAENLATLIDLQSKNGLSFLYESAACASIPVIRNLEEYYDNDLLHSFRGIINGSTNFILSKILDEGLDYASALSLAQNLGFAESDPSLDVSGQDAANKFTFLLTHAYGLIPTTNDILFNGIEQISANDAKFASEKNYAIKLVAQAKKLNDGSIAAVLLPQYVQKDEHLAHVNNEFNGIEIESSFADKQFFLGKGAGSYPTASAILSDIAALRYDYKYEYKKRIKLNPLTRLSTDFYLKIYLSAEDLINVPLEEFEYIETYYVANNNSHLTGYIHYKELKNNDWWRKNGISIILAPDPIIEKDTLQILKESRKNKFTLDDILILE